MPFERIRRQLDIPWQRTLYVMFIAQFTTAVGFSSIFPFLPLYVKDLGSTTGLSVELLAGLVFSGQAFTMMLASPIWGALADRYGRKLMVQRATFGGAVLALMMAFSRSAEDLVILRAIQGFVTGTLAASNALVAAAAPRERTGYAMGLLQVGLGTGVAIGPLIGGAAADAFGYAAVFYITSGLLALAGLLVLVGVEEDFVPEEAPGGPAFGLVGRWSQILERPGVRPTYSLRFLTQLGRMMVIPIAPLFVEQLLAGGSGVNTITGFVIGIGAAMATLGAMVFGNLGDRVGHRPIVFAVCAASAVLYAPQSLVGNVWQLLALWALVGIALGGILPTISALLAGYTREGEEGAAYGLDNSITAAARALAPLVGSGVALAFGLRATFVAAGLVYVLATAVAAWRLPAVRAPAAAAAQAEGAKPPH